jgi:hypothetical protein
MTIKFTGTDSSWTQDCDESNLADVVAEVVAELESAEFPRITAGRYVGMMSYIPAEIKEVVNDVKDRSFKIETSKWQIEVRSNPGDK